MEFYASATIRTDAAALRRRLTIATLPQWCASIDAVLGDEGSHGEIYCVWGAFRLHREELCDGVRFTLPGCPNALQWTITTGRPPDPGQLIVHLTINRVEHDADFIASNRRFVDDWRIGLESRW